MIELRGALTEAEVIAFQRYHLWRQTKWTTFIMLFILVFFAWASLVSDDWQEHNRRIALSNRFLLVLMAFAWLIAIATTPTKQGKKTYAEQKAIRETAVAQFDVDEVRGEGPSLKWTLKWDNYNCGRETKSLYLLYISPNAATIVPKRLFASEVEQAEWRNLVASSIPSRRIEPIDWIGRWI